MELPGLFAEHGDLNRYPPQRRILLAALDCISESGLEGVTVRAIASRAGLNPAAVNYYYRSKDRLIEEALRAAWTHVAEDIDLIMREVKDNDALTRVASRYLLEGSFGSPRILKAVMLEHPALHLEVATFLKGIFARLRKRSGSRNADDLGSLLLVAFSVLLSIGPDVAAVFLGVDLSDPAARKRLWDALHVRLFAKTHTRSTAGSAHQKASPRLK